MPRPVKIWVDADACPVVIKDILFRAATRTGTVATLVANQPIQVPNSPFIRTIQVSPGFDVADNEIVRRLEAHDLAIEDALSLFEEGVGRLKSARGRLGEAETRVMQVLKETADDGTLRIEPLDG